MIYRIVKLHFKLTYTDDFIKLFSEKKENIKCFEGCLSLQLVQDENDPQTFFTLSTWTSATALDFYRSSDFFKHMWSHIRQEFSDSPQAWTTKVPIKHLD